MAKSNWGGDNISSNTTVTWKWTGSELVPAVEEKRGGLAPHVCPVCSGRGNVPSGFYYGGTTTNAFEECRACNGKGVLWG